MDSILQYILADRFANLLKAIKKEALDWVWDMVNDQPSCFAVAVQSQKTSFVMMAFAHSDDKEFIDSLVHEVTAITNRMYDERYPTMLKATEEDFRNETES